MTCSSAAARSARRRQPQLFDDDWVPTTAQPKRAAKDRTLKSTGWRVPRNRSQIPIEFMGEDPHASPGSPSDPERATRATKKTVRGSPQPPKAP